MNMNCNDHQFRRLTADQRAAVTRRTFLSRSASGIGLAALGSLLNENLFAAAPRAGAGIAAGCGRTPATRRPHCRDNARLDALWLRVLNRPITATERNDAIAFLGSLKISEPARWMELCHSLLASNEFVFRL